ncbi:MAG: MBL fold metallo-hydrolase [Lachnospiraceae bacterium]|nr:MBL fold metallo-hydrolase [Lachnospiraceae bacterium]
MIEEVCKNIYRIGVALPGNPLRELNSYFLRGDDRDLLIDTGFRRPVCREALQAGLDELGSDPARRDVLCTHLHSDHSGMADLFAGPGRRIYMGRTDLARISGLLPVEAWLKMYTRFPLEGFSEELLREVFASNPARTEAMPKRDPRLTPLDDGDILSVGPYRLETLLVPGHTPGNCMFYLREQRIMFTGDHILFDITPNITSWPGVADSLGDYLASLRRVRDLPVDLALPGHRKTGDYGARIDQLLAHHERRLAEALSIIRSEPGLCAYEIAGRMKWKIRAADWDSFPVIQKWFATGECFSHLDYHLTQGTVLCVERDGLRRYYPAD